MTANARRFWAIGVLCAAAALGACGGVEVRDVADTSPTTVVDPVPTTGPVSSATTGAVTEPTDSIDATAPAPSPDATVPQSPDDLGDDPTLDALAQGCFGGDFAACDRLFFDSEADSAYEAYGDSCGGRNEPAGLCVDIYGDG